MRTHNAVYSISVAKIMGKSRKIDKQLFQFRFQSVTPRWPQILKISITDYTMYWVVEKIDGKIIYLTFVLIHE